MHVWCTGSNGKGSSKCLVGVHGFNGKMSHHCMLAI